MRIIIMLLMAIVSPIMFAIGCYRFRSGVLMMWLVLWLISWIGLFAIR